jgi:glycosyltransferase involved in cell wall biosynthesis
VLPDRFNWPKPANKSVILNWFGLPVIASANRSNLEWIKYGSNGFTALTDDEWFNALISFDDRSLARMQVASERKAKYFMKNYHREFSSLFRSLR